MARQFDHLVHCVHDLEAAHQRFRSLGFTVRPPAVLPFGVRNRVVLLENAFIELLTVDDPGAIPPATPGNFSFAGRPDEVDQQHLFEVAQASGRPVFFLGFDASARSYVEGATPQGAQLHNLLRVIRFNPRFTLKKTTYFANLDGWES